MTSLPQIKIKSNKDEVDWVIIFKFKEIYNLLNFYELIELSLICKEVYYKARPFLLSEIFISAPLIAKNLEVNSNSNSSNDDENLNYLPTEFKQYIKTISNHVNSIQIKEIPLTQDPYQYLKIFNNIQSLHFYHRKTKINLINLNLILVKLDNLKVLKLSGITILFEENEITNNLSIPCNLIKLAINNCYWPVYNKLYYNNPIIIPPLGPYSSLSTQNFPKLINFEYSSLDSHLNFNPISSILKNSPKLETLSLEATYLNQETFNLISKSKTLKFIKLKDLDGSNVKIDDFSLHLAYLTVTSISYSFIDHTSRTLSNIELLFSKLPNLTQLSISFGGKQFSQYLKKILNNLKNLKILEIINLSSDKKSLTLKLNNLSVKSLNLVNFKLIQVNFRDFYNWKALKCIKLDFNNNNNGSSSSSSSSRYLNSEVYNKKENMKLKLDSNWKVFNYTNCIRFYKE